MLSLYDPLESLTRTRTHALYCSLQLGQIWVFYFVKAKSKPHSIDVEILITGSPKSGLLFSPRPLYLKYEVPRYIVVSQIISMWIISVAKSESRSSKLFAKLFWYSYKRGSEDGYLGIQSRDQYIPRLFDFTILYHLEIRW